MKTILALASVSVAVASHAEDFNPTELVSCEPGLAPVESSSPAFPRRLHNEFSGTAQIGYIVAENGNVTSPEVLHQEWQPIGNASGQPLGYEEAILAAVADWKFASRSSACWNVTILEVSFSGDVNALASRSNKALNFVPALWASTGRALRAA